MTDKSKNKPVNTIIEDIRTIAKTYEIEEKANKALKEIEAEKKAKIESQRVVAASIGGIAAGQVTGPPSNDTPGVPPISDSPDGPPEPPQTPFPPNPVPPPAGTSVDVPGNNTGTGNSNSTNTSSGGAINGGLGAHYPGQGGPNSNVPGTWNAVKGATDQIQGTGTGSTGIVLPDDIKQGAIDQVRWDQGMIQPGVYHADQLANNLPNDTYFSGPNGTQYDPVIQAIIGIADNKAIMIIMRALYDSDVIPFGWEDRADTNYIGWQVNKYWLAGGQIEATPEQVIRKIVASNRINFPDPYPSGYGSAYYDPTTLVQTDPDQWTVTWYQGITDGVTIPGPIVTNIIASNCAGIGDPGAYCTATNPIRPFPITDTFVMYYENGAFRYLESDSEVPEYLKNGPSLISFEDNSGNGYEVGLTNFGGFYFTSTQTPTDGGPFIPVVTMNANNTLRDVIDKRALPFIKAGSSFINF